MLCYANFSLYCGSKNGYAITNKRRNLYHYAKIRSTKDFVRLRRKILPCDSPRLHQQLETVSCIVSSTVRFALTEPCLFWQEQWLHVLNGPVFVPWDRIKSSIDFITLQRVRALFLLGTLLVFINKYYQILCRSYY